MNESQEPKYGITGHRLRNRHTGEFIPEDEPVFIFRARDVHAVAILEAYHGLLTVKEHADAVDGRIADFTRFAQEHPDRMHEPGSGAPPKSKPVLGKGLGALLPKKARTGAELAFTQIVVAPSHLVGLDTTGAPWIMPLHALGKDVAIWDSLPLPGEQ